MKQHQHLAPFVLPLVLVGCNSVETKPTPITSSSRDTSKANVSRTSLGYTFPGFPPGEHPPYADSARIRVRYQPPIPPYPTSLKIAGIQGTVVVKLIVEPNGNPIYAEAVEGPSELRKLAMEYAMQWRFEPILQDGKPRYTELTLKMPFRLH
ncbi:energy transducer TonB [Geothrix sp.]|jgi:TonB family protein|uniref:energy transducer TonB n=1 Tax=Geothrix sp. TaxID=1962974 RepID=UPI00344B9D6F